MSLRRLSCAVASASALLACGHSATPHVAAPPLDPKSTGYLTIAPEVSVSRSAREYEAKQETLDPDADVMAEILAIPPGG